MLRWKNSLIHADDSIKHAMEVIDSQGARTAVISEHGYLKGIVTDGDIRRGILNGHSIDESVSSIMNDSPVTADSHCSQSNLSQLFSNHDIHVLPLVNEDNQIVDLKFIDDESDVVATRDNPVFIMAGGFGTRLKPLTNDCPKPMLKVGQRPILEIILNNFIKLGFTNFYISTYYLPEMIKNHFGDGSTLGVDIHYVHEDKPLGTAGALGLMKNDFIDKPVIVVNADILTTVNFSSMLDFHLEMNNVATVAVREYEYQIPYGVISCDDQRVLDIEEKPKNKIFINAGLYVLDPALLASIPYNEVLDMPTFIKDKVTQGQGVSTFPVYEYWLDIGQMDDYKRAQVDFINLNI